MNLPKRQLWYRCFWCTEAIFKELEGVISVMPGYSCGQTVNPTYKEVWEVRNGIRRMYTNCSLIFQRSLTMH